MRVKIGKLSVSLRSIAGYARAEKITRQGTMKRIQAGKLNYAVIDGIYLILL